jgi:hypothetical protein
MLGILLVVGVIGYLIWRQYKSINTFMTNVLMYLAIIGSLAIIVGIFILPIYILEWADEYGGILGSLVRTILLYPEAVACAIMAVFAVCLLLYEIWDKYFGDGTHAPKGGKFSGSGISHFDKEYGDGGGE